MKKLATIAAVGLLAAALTLPAGSAAADGPECNVYSHCYGTASYPTGGNIDGVAVDLWTDCLHLDTPNSDFATHEMWMWTNASPGTMTWLEGGYQRGIAAGGNNETWFQWFWAEYTGSAFYSHHIQYASVADWKQLWFAHYGDDTWGIYLGGSYAGQTAQHATAGTYVQVGGETTEPEVYSHGKSRYLQWHGWGASSWTGASTGIATATSGVYSASASGAGMEQTSLKKICSPAPLRATAPEAKAPSTQDLKDVAVKVAAQYGEASPTGIEVVSTTRMAAQRAVGAGDKVESDQKSYLVQLRGAFVGHAPQGKKVPRGNTMTLTVDAATGVVTDLSLSTAHRDLAKLGSVKQL